ncbi:MAG: ABC transporter substrate-binding protein, partial [Burkholderiaceae bacterium]
MIEASFKTIAALAFGVGLAGAAPAALAQTPKNGGTLVYATGIDAQTLDPQFVTDIPTFRVVRYIYEPLTQQDAAGKVIPALATSWKLSDDKRTWTFQLRKGVKFHDGSTFDAQAVKFTFDRLNDPATGSPRRSTLAAVEEVKVVDDY